MYFRSLLVFFVLLNAPVSDGVAQTQQIARARLEGSVFDMATGNPLEGAHIFVSRSSIGAVSDTDGAFRFLIPLGANRIVVSRVGHKTQIHDVMVRAPRSYFLNFDLEEEVIERGDLTISDVRDKKWDKRLEKFKTFFIGSTANAREVEILNPEILDLSESEGTLVAGAETPLLIENQALGYRIEHHLHHFVVDGEETWQDGESFFIKMTPANEKQAQKWGKNRLKAYRGSAQHFFNGMMRNRSRQEGFQVFHVEDPGEVGDMSEAERNSIAPLRKPQFAVNPYIYLSEGPSEQDFILDFNDYLQIVYTREREDRAYVQWQKVYHSGEVRSMQHSWIRLQNGPATLDPQGNSLNPYAVAFYGYMSFERLADLLPKEYRPN